MVEALGKTTPTDALQRRPTVAPGNGRFRRETPDEGPCKPLHIGVVSGGRSNDAVAAEVRRLREGVDHAIEQFAPDNRGGQADVMVQFHLPGDVISPDFQGMRIGSWLGHRRCQIVQVAMPADLCEPAGIAEFLASNLQDALRLAAHYLRFRRSPLSTSHAALVATIAACEIRGTNP